jgi:hypothetical protein
MPTPKDIETYNPVYARPSDAWYPTNEAADLLVHLSHIWEDIIRLNRIRCETREGRPEEDKLLFKYIIVEFASLFDPLSRLQTLIAKAKTLVRGRPAPLRYVTPKEKQEAKALFKGFWRAQAPLQCDIFGIRNTIGAHRRLQPWPLVTELWEKLDPERYVAAMNTFIPLFKFVQALNLYEWSRAFGDGSFSIMGARIIHDWSDTDEPTAQTKGA